MATTTPDDKDTSRLTPEQRRQRELKRRRQGQTRGMSDPRFQAPGVESGFAPQAPPTPAEPSGPDWYQQLQEEARQKDLERQLQEEEEKERKRREEQERRERQEDELDRIRKEQKRQEKFEQEQNKARQEAREAEGGKPGEASKGVEGAEARGTPQVARVGAQGVRGVGGVATEGAAPVVGGGGVVAGEGVVGVGAAAEGGAVAAAPVIGWVLLVIVAVIVWIITMIFFIITILIVVCNTGGAGGWVVRKVGDLTGYLPETICQALSATSAGQQGPPLQSSGSCTQAQLADFATQYGTPLTPKNSASLTALMGCISGQVTISGAVATFDQSHPTCNVTRGDPKCDTSCFHAPNSCHYGGSKDNLSGHNGALAVDYGLGGAANKAQYANQIITAANQCKALLAGLGDGIKDARCEAGSSGTVNCTDPSADHVHISLSSCDKN